MQQVFSKRNKKKAARADLLFYIGMMIYPIVQFCVFYIYAKFKSFILPFQEIDVFNNTVTYTFDTMKEALWDTFNDSYMLHTRKMSFFRYIYGVVINLPLGIFVSFYIYKKLPGSGAFRVLLYLPSIVSGIVMALMYQKFAELAFPELVLKAFDIKIKGLFENPDTQLVALLFYSTVFGLGGNVLLYSDNMGAIDQELVESAHLDGAEGIKEFWYITLPSIYPLLTTFIVTGVVGMFTSDLGLFAFWGTSAPAELSTYGYYLYIMTLTSSESGYPYLAALGLILTCVAVPVTFLVRWAMEKWGPSED